MKILARARHAAAWRIRRLRKFVWGSTPQRDETVAPRIARKLRVIEEGLKDDDWVVVSGIQRARPGAKVTPVKEGATPGAATPKQQ